MFLTPSLNSSDVLLHINHTLNLIITKKQYNVVEKHGLQRVTVMDSAMSLSQTPGSSLFIYRIKVKLPALAG